MKSTLVLPLAAATLFVAGVSTSHARPYVTVHFDSPKREVVCVKKFRHRHPRMVVAKKKHCGKNKFYKKRAKRLRSNFWRRHHFISHSPVITRGGYWYWRP